MDLELINNEIISIYENKEGQKMVSARELHKVLGNKRKFADWIKQRIEQYKFIETGYKRLWK